MIDLNELENFSDDIIDKMLYYQEKQGNKKDIKVFQKSRTACKSDGGFSWEETEEGFDYWRNLLTNSQINRQIKLDGGFEVKPGMVVLTKKLKTYTIYKDPQSEELIAIGTFKNNLNIQKPSKLLPYIIEVFSPDIDKRGESNYFVDRFLGSYVYIKYNVVWKLKTLPEEILDFIINLNKYYGCKDFLKKEKLKKEIENGNTYNLFHHTSGFYISRKLYEERKIIDILKSKEYSEFFKLELNIN